MVYVLERVGGQVLGKEEKCAEIDTEIPTPTYRRLTSALEVRRELGQKKGPKHYYHHCIAK